MESLVRVSDESCVGGVVGLCLQRGVEEAAEEVLLEGSIRGGGSSGKGEELQGERSEGRGVHVGGEGLEKGEDMQVVGGKARAEVGGFESGEEAVRHFAEVESGAMASWAKISNV